MSTSARNKCLGVIRWLIINGKLIGSTNHLRSLWISMPVPNVGEVASSIDLLPSVG